ncbi:3-methylaspartate ammonia-lyase [Deltaproteobacteria bacterium Smac51]|nr:3-methylaspartate ammonia-lyase [Deltaproteobacteria bacterium Smac51]
MEEIRILSPTAILGYGFPESSFQAALAKNPHVIAVDAGSTDPGPYYLGSGISFTDRAAVKRDLALMIPAALERKIPVIVGTAGGCGADSHLQWCIEIVREISKEQGLTFKMATISSEIKHDDVLKNMAAGKVKPLHPAPELTRELVDQSTSIVAQMGVEPFIKALDMGAEVILAGRAYDPAVFASLAVKEGFDPGLAIHMGKILECAAIAATPGSGSDCMFGTLRKDHFILEPLSPERKCTTLSVAAHTLYEKTNPLILPGPGGVLDLNQTTFTQATENSVMVKGSRFVPIPADQKYTIKLEGARRVGFRTVSFAATADPIMIRQMDKIVEGVRARVKSNFNHLDEKSFFLDFKIYGQKGVMSMFKGLPPASEHQPAELAIIIEAVAPTQSEANTICGFARSTMLHYGYEGRISTAGNLAFPFSPSDFKAGEVYEFSVYHLMDVDDPCQYFPIQMKNCAKGECHEI